MRYLCVLYDARCGVCTQLKGWLMQQPAFVPLYLIAAGSDEARRRYPNQTFDAGELAVISDSGQVWLGNHAWIICLWALREYRGWAQRLSTPALLPLARQGFLASSSNRFALSRLLGLRSEEDVRTYLRTMPNSTCEVNVR